MNIYHATLLLFFVVSAPIPAHASEVDAIIHMNSQLGIKPFVTYMRDDFDYIPVPFGTRIAIPKKVPDQALKGC